MNRKNKSDSASKKFLLIGPKTDAVVNFRGDLIRDVKKKGYDVVVAVPEDNNKEFFKKNGVRVRIVNLKKNSLSAINALAYQRALEKIIREEKPDKVF